MSTRDPEDFAAEIQAHLDLEADRLREHGAPPAEARAAARRAFGNVTAAREAFYERRRPLWWEALARDVRYAARTLARSPRFTIAAIATLALGIGANTAILSLADDALFRPLPLPHPDRLTAIYHFDRRASRYLSSSYPEYQELTAAGSLEQVAAYVRLPLAATFHQTTEYLPVEAVTPNYFSMLELAPLAGRAFSAADDTAAMLSEDLWRERFHADPGVIGRTIQLEDQPFTVVGIVPRRYRGAILNWSDPPRLWITLAGSYRALPRLAALDILRHREMRWLLILGRLRPGVTAAAAQGELSALGARGDVTVTAFPAGRARFWPAYRDSIARSLAVFAAAGVLVLLLACANVSGLLLERALARRREIAIRLAVGAGRARLLRQLFTENLLLAIPGLAAALGVAALLLPILARFPNALGLPLALSPTLDHRALLCSCLLATAATLLFGVAPALAGLRTAVLPALKDSPGAAGGRLRSALVVVQVAFSAVLLLAGGLYLRGLLRAYSTDLGYRPGHLLTATLGRHPDPVRFAARISALPGVQAAALASELPLAGAHPLVQVSGAAGTVAARSSTISPGYLRAMGIALTAGRDFDLRDTPRAPRVALVNQSLARMLGYRGSPVGGTLLLNGKTRIEIAGMTADSRMASPFEDPAPYLYLPLAQSGAPPRHLVLRTLAPPESVAAALRREWQREAPRSPLYAVSTGDHQVDLALGPQRLAAALLGAFALLATLLAAVGLYGVVACAVAQRTREIGIRMALGATGRAVLREVLGSACRMAGIGLLLGVAGGLLLTRMIAPQARTSPYDAAVFGAVVLLLAGVAFAAALIPARRAARVDPLAALKYE